VFHDRLIEVEGVVEGGWMLMYCVDTLFFLLVMGKVVVVVKVVVVLYGW